MEKLSILICGIYFQGTATSRTQSRSGLRITLFLYGLSLCHSNPLLKCKSLAVLSPLCFWWGFPPLLRGPQSPFQENFIESHLALKRYIFSPLLSNGQSLETAEATCKAENAHRLSKEGDGPLPAFPPLRCDRATCKQPLKIPDSFGTGGDKGAGEIFQGDKWQEYKKREGGSKGHVYSWGLGRTRTMQNLYSAWTEDQISCDSKAGWWKRWEGSRDIQITG